MLDSFIYEDHLGRRFVGLDNNVFLNYSELRDYSWKYDTINNRISRFYRGITSRKIPLVVVCNNATEAANVRNRLLELAETDIEARQPGKVWVGDYYTNGYITASEKSDYLVNKRYCVMELTLTSDDPAWYTDKLYHFVSDNAPVGSDTLTWDGDTEGVETLDLEYGYLFYKISDSAPTEADLSGGCTIELTVYSGGELEGSEHGEVPADEIEPADGVTFIGVGDLAILAVPKAIDADGFSIQAGTYFPYIGESGECLYISSLTVPGYTGFPSTNSTPLDYPFDYPYEYSIGQKEQNIVCDTISSNAFRLTIYGAAANPSVTIGGHTYMVNGDVGAGETLVIDSLTKTITLTTATGSKVNWFDNRNRESYIFQPIPSGVNAISWSGSFGFELTVIEKRSEPKWT